MQDFLILLVHLMVTVARLAGPGGLRSVVQSVLVQHQLLVLSEVANVLPICEPPMDHHGIVHAFHTPGTCLRSAIILKPSTLLHFHSMLSKRKYRILFSPKRRHRPGPKGPDKDLIDAVVAMKQRNPIGAVPASLSRSRWLSASRSTRMWFAES